MRRNSPPLENPAGVIYVAMEQNDAAMSGSDLTRGAATLASASGGTA